VMVGLLLDEGDAVAAFEFSERSRGRSFIDLLGNQKIGLHSETDSGDLERERELRGRVEDLERRHAQAEEDSETEARERELEAARRAYADFLIDLRVKNPQLASFVEVPTQDLASLQALIEPRTRLLVYHALPEELVAWVIGRDSIRVTRTPVRRQELAGRIQGFRQRLQNFDDVNEELAILSRLLLEPNLPLLGDAEQVCVVPHRELHRMPFAALRIGLESFIDRYALFFSPSASVLQYTYGRSGADGERRTAQPRVLAIGNPDLGDAAFALPFAQKEAERIAWTFPGAEVVTGERASKSWLRDNSERFDAIHLAAHGEYDAALPLLSSILLTGDEEDDGRLTAQEVFSLTLNANFVALSACQSGLGKLSNGDDIIGLNRAFVYAGTRQILSTLWRVDDVSTAVLIKHFYRNSETMSRAGALRAAQIEVRRRYPHPAHWAGVFLSGDWK
jgi:CHAT domain-containing protein